MIYWIVSSLLRRQSPRTAALVTWAVTSAVECFKLVRTPALDRFRLTLPGILLLGRFFSFADLAAYTLAILTGALLDRSLRSTRTRDPALR